MFSKYVTLLALVATAIAGAIEPGVYRITNVASYSTARSYQDNSPVYVSSTREYPGPFQLVSSDLCLCLGINSNYLPHTTVGHSRLYGW